MTVYFDSNVTNMTIRADSTAYLVGERINPANNRVGRVFECTVAGTTAVAEPGKYDVSAWQAGTLYNLTSITVNNVANSLLVRFKVSVTGTSGGAEPVWNTTVGGTTIDGTVTWTTIEWFRTTADDLSVDGSVTWKAVEPTAWVDAMLTASGAMGAWLLDADKAQKIYGELLHREFSSGGSVTMGLDFSDAQHNIRPAIYRVDKTTGIYNSALSDNTTHINFEAFLTVVFGTAARFHGFNFSSDRNIKFNYRYGTILEDCKVTFGAASLQNYISWSGHDYTIFIACEIVGTASINNYFLATDSERVLFIGSKISVQVDATGLIQRLNEGGEYANMEFRDCDMSGVTSPILVDTSDMDSGSAASNSRAQIKFIDCKLPINYALWDGTLGMDLSTYISAEGCSDGSERHLNTFRDIAGERSTEVAIYLTNGYFEPTAGANLSQALATESGANRFATVKSSKIGVYVTTTGAKVFTIQMLENFTTPLNNSEVWVDFYYYEGATDAFHKIDTSTKRFAELSYTALNAGSGLSEWSGTTTGYRSVQLQVPVTVAREGIAYGVIHLGKYESGKRLLIDPLFLET